MKRVVCGLMGLVVAGAVQAVCYELRAQSGEVLRASPEPIFTEGKRSLARDISEERGEYVTTSEGECAPVKRQETTVASIPRTVSGAPACQAHDGTWHRYGSLACDKIPIPDWVERDLQTLGIVRDLTASCRMSIEVNGRDGLAHEDCVSMREANQGFHAIMQRWSNLPDGAVRPEHLRMLRDIASESEATTRAIKESRPQEIRIVR